MNCDSNNNALPKIGDVVHGYQIVRFLYETNYSFLYIAIKPTTSHKMVLKFLKQMDLNQKSSLSEAQITQEIHSSYVIPLIEKFEHNRFVILVFPYAQGGDLLNMIQNLPSPRFTEKMVKNIAKSLLLGLKDLHDNNIVHRDVKLENMLVLKKDDNNIHVVLSDLGLAEKLPKGKKTIFNYGTLEYSAPEIIQGIPSDFSSDMWSLGVAVYTLLSGGFPFPTGKEAILRTCICRGIYGFPMKTWSGISEEAKDFVSQLLAIHPSLRMNAQEALQHKWLSETE